MNEELYNLGRCFFLAQQGIHVLKPRYSPIPPPIEPVLKALMESARQEKKKRNATD